MAAVDTPLPKTPSKTARNMPIETSAMRESEALNHLADLVPRLDRSWPVRTTDSGSRVS